MTEPQGYNHQRYLIAKKTVTDRALDQRVWDKFMRKLHNRQVDSLRILDVGGGVGSMALRVWENVRQLNIDYTIVDQSKTALQGAKEVFAANGLHEKEGNGNIGSIDNKGYNISIHLVQSDIFDFLQRYRSSERGFHIVIASSILDLIALRPFLDHIKPLLKGLQILYCPENFNGKTTFLPTLEDSTGEEDLIHLYHDSMCRDTPQGRNEGPKTGRLLLQTLSLHGAKIDAAASSDWIVLGDNGEYPNDEAYFLHHILHFVEQEIDDHPDADEFHEWVKIRRGQINAGELIYIAHQLDVLAHFE